MERGRSLFIFKVKGQGHWAFTKNSSTWILVGEQCNLGCSNLVCSLHMERGRSLFIFKVKGQFSRSLGLSKEFLHLDPCGQDYDIARTIQSRLFKLSMYTSYGKREKPLYFQGQRSRSLGVYKEF